MNNIEYAAKAKRTLPNLTFKEVNGVFVRVCDDEIGTRLNLTHMSLGLSSEIGELVNCTGTELKIRVDIPNLKEELGDIYWYLANYCNLRDIIPPEGEIVNQLPTERCFELLISAVGELVDIVKKLIAYNREIEKAKEMEAVYDIYSALNLFEGAYSLDGNEIRQKNIDKLTIRYPHKFSDEQAINRNTDQERKLLES